MKKLLLSAALVAISVVTFAQKQAAGDKNIEVNFSPLGGSPIGINGLKFRYFTSDQSALRLGFNASMANTKTATGTTADGSVTLFDREGTTNISIRPGIERHFAGTSRLSPYVGAELDFGMQMHKIVSESENGTTANQVDETTTKGTNGFMRIGANAVAGADFYFSDKIYMGVEVGFGLQMISNSDIKVELPAGTSPADQEQGSSFNFGPTVNTSIRLGFLF